MRLRRLSVAAALLALPPTSAWASGGVWAPLRVAPAVAHGSADLPHMAMEADGTAVAAWSEDGTVRAATRAPGKSFAAPRAVAMSSTLAVPDATVAVGSRALVLLHAQQGTGATLVAASVTGPSVGGPEQAAATTVPITEAAAALRADGSALAAYAVASSPMTISSAARAAAGGWAPAGDVVLPAGVTLVQQLRLSPLPDGGAVMLFLGQGAAPGDVPRPYAALRPPAGGWALPVALDPGAVVACADLGLAVDVAGNAYATWSVSDGRVRTAQLPAGGAFGAAQTAATTGRTPRVAVAPAGGGVLLAWIDVSGQPVLRTSEWSAAGLTTAASTPLPTAATTLESLALADSTAASAIVTETTGTGDAQRSGADVLERPAAATPWATQNVRTGLVEPVGSPQLAMSSLGAFALWVEGSVIVASGSDHGLPRVLALAKPKKVGIGVLGPFSVRASDTWSPITDVTWRYGDGTSERGASVRHAYSRAGSFHVTVLVHDAAGNTAQRTFVVVATPLARALSATATAVSATATTGGLKVLVACLPSNPSVTGTITAALPGAKPVPFRCTVGGSGTAVVPGPAKRGKRVVVRVTSLDLAGLPHLRASTLTTL
jgi:PKD domain